MFSKLKCVNLMMNFENQVDLANVAPILGACPLLEEFYLIARCKVWKGEQSGASWPTTCHSHLKKMELNGFLGSNEMEFASYIMRSTLKLEQLVLQMIYKKYIVDGLWQSETIARHMDEEKRFHDLCNLCHYVLIVLHVLWNLQSMAREFVH